MTALHDAISAHAEPAKRRRIPVPEWSMDGGKTPLVVFYDMVTLDDMSTVNEIAKSGALVKIAPYLVCLKALDEQGQKLFQMGDAAFLRSSAAPDIVQGIALKMLGRVSLEEALGN